MEVKGDEKRTVWVNEWSQNENVLAAWQKRACEGNEWRRKQDVLSGCAN